MTLAVGMAVENKGCSIDVVVVVVVVAFSVNQSLTVMKWATKYSHMQVFLYSDVISFCVLALVTSLYLCCSIVAILFNVAASLTSRFNVVPKS